MGRVYRKPKDIEQFLIWEFVRDALGCTISQPKWRDRPDAILTLRKGKIKTRVAIEHTGYFNDTVPGTYSPLTPISDFWKCVQTSLGWRVSHRKHLADVMGSVQLNAKQFAKQSDSKKNEELARRFAKEFVEFLEDCPISESKLVRYPSPSTGATYCRLLWTSYAGMFGCFRVDTAGSRTNASTSPCLAMR